MEKNKWIAHERICPDNRVNLFCFTFPGGSASNFAPWKKLIDERINFIPVLYPEREIRKNDAMEESFDLFIEDFVNENAKYLKMPYAFFGYCGGAVLAYEASVLAKERFSSEPVWGLIASSEAPEYLRDSLIGWPGEDTKDDVKKYLTGLGMDSRIVESDMFIEYYAPLLKADCRMLDTYVHRIHEKLDCDLIVMKGKEDTSVKPEKTAAWSDVTSGEVSFEERQGGHFFVDEQREDICEIINKNILERFES